MLARVVGSMFARGAAAAALLLLLAPSEAPAALGDNVSSIDADGAHLRSAIRVTTAARYAVHELMLTSGGTVREYVGPDGTVFALGWSSPWPPDLRQLLGAYFPRFAQAAASRGIAHRPLIVQDDGLVVQFGGRARAFVGNAYLTDRLPAGVAAEELR
jgi:hypothetical protein